MMKTNWTKALLGSAVAISLVAAPAMANFGEWDANGDAGIDNEEFAAGFDKDVGVFGDWDTDDDNMLSQAEFDAGYGTRDTAESPFDDDIGFDDWDANDDDMLSSTEFHDGVYAAYDDDGDNIIEEPEFGDLGDDIGDGGFWDV
ncbi:hypothetical protein SJ05684_b43070 (plasmid) [Sinorhizobium sojae CCBAU 05684]|uniref:EF-hand domain-containing protein n=1 Tax=Sinorhizobium sojae CCBAU 05684 TaxID=716928 RepID=A0A249PIY2_9HYPH|nr:hypothetical protein [Sinorhizobium sojae]ASY65289.1 hypothetical protein SJ05684_b43070 [Sinorhizobium sojae CCBAU 05684]